MEQILTLKNIENFMPIIYSECNQGIRNKKLPKNIRQ